MYFFVNYFFPVKPVIEYIEKNKFKRINFFIDFLSISRGIYNSKIISSTTFLKDENLWFNETKKYLNWLRKYFSRYEPIFIIFSDDGIYKHHLKIFPEYKANRSELEYLTVDKFYKLDLKNLIQYLKGKTFEKLIRYQYDTDDLIFIKLKDEESDIVPFIFIKNNFLDSSALDTLNIILSTDKDLLQNLKFKNSIQIIRKKENKKIVTKIFNFRNSIYYLVGEKDKKSEKNRLENFYENTAELIPYFLAIAGDKSDGIPGIPKIGYKTIYNELIKKFSEIKGYGKEISKKVNLEFFLNLPKVKKQIFKSGDEFKKIIFRNLQLVDFEKIYEENKNKLYREIKNKILDFE